MAMASTTAAAATMLLSGSMPSSDTTPYSQNVATLTASAPFPTVTLDLTTNHSADPSIQPHQPRPFFPTGDHSTISAASNSSQQFVNAIAADPNFSAALAAAISSIIGGAQPNNGVDDHNGSPKNTRDVAN